MRLRERIGFVGLWTVIPWGDGSSSLIGGLERGGALLEGRGFTGLQNATADELTHPLF